MGTHVFIVNDDTFPIHLQYMFAGTGASTGQKKNKIWLDWHAELLSDIKRIRPGDYVIFYKEASIKDYGGFYGIFKISDSKPLIFHTPCSSGNQPGLNNYKLIYRTLIEPYEVYSEGVPEWEALDKLPSCSTDIQWSLIYRKLKGKRGCTPLLPWESDKLIDLIKSKNNCKFLPNSSYKGLDWDSSNRKIKPTQNISKYSFSRNFNYNTINEICNLLKLNKRRAYEVLLQLYFTENIGNNTILDPIVGKNVRWFGNEVGAGVGMQKIDILTINSNDEVENNIEYRIIEIKDENVKPEIMFQLESYVNWASQNLGRHLENATNQNIIPVIVAPEFKDKKNPNRLVSPDWQNVVNAFNNFNNKKISQNIQYFEFNLDCINNTITFKSETY